MANIKISQLPGGTTPLSGAELFPCVEAASTVRVPASSLVGSLVTPGGSGTQLQYRQSGSIFGGMSGTCWDDANQILRLAKYAQNPGSIRASVLTSETLLATDNGGVLTVNNASPVTLTERYLRIFRDLFSFF
jgi:hypothetical protein